MRTFIAAASFFAAAASAHGNITFPPARKTGVAMATLCGQTAVDNLNADPTIPVEDVGTVNPGCDASLCRGAQFEDNANNVQQFRAGQVVPMEALISIPHAGPMNVSIVKTATNTVLGSPLVSFDVYADDSLAVIPLNNSVFTVTMPNMTTGDCAVAGACVVQWFWFGEKPQQTYESCVDFVMV